MNDKLIRIENTKFIFRTNFSGNPEMDRFGSTQRKGNILIPANLAKELAEKGFNVKETLPRDGEEDGFNPEYFVSILVNFNSKYPPKIMLVSGDNPPVPLDAESISIIDKSRISSVDVILNPHEYTEGKFTLYVTTMYVTQDLDDDPFAAKYARQGRFEEEIKPDMPDDEDLPF